VLGALLAVDEAALPPFDPKFPREDSKGKGKGKGAKGEGGKGGGGRGGRTVRQKAPCGNWVLDLMTGKSVRESEVQPQWDEVVATSPSPDPAVDSAFLELVEAAETLRYGDLFKTTSNRIRTFAKLESRGRVVAHARGTAPILHAATAALLEDFLATKRAHGSPEEQELYQTITTSSQMVTRLLSMRPLHFEGPIDDFTLRNGTPKKSVQNGGFSADFESIGGGSARGPLVLREYLSYDEMALSSLLGVATPTHWINDGSKSNQAKADLSHRFIREGVCVALVGARFERPPEPPDVPGARLTGLMEFRHILVSESQNQACHGYGSTAAGADAALMGAWAKAYGFEYFPTWADAIGDTTGRFVEVATRSGRSFLDTVAYKRRCRLGVEPFLIDANDRALALGRKAYVALMGLGLGCWAVAGLHPGTEGIQKRIQLEAYLDVLQDRALPAIAHLNFAYAWENGCGGEEYTDPANRFGQCGASITFTRRNPASLLPKEYEDALLVANYAWDGNAYPGPRTL